jgi:hypothetical protein
MLHLTESTPFTGEVAFHPSPVFDPPYQLTASINWGDGTAGSTGTEQLTAGVGAFGYETTASHTYRKTGTFKVVTTLTLKSIDPTLNLPPIFVARIDSNAVVAKEPKGHEGGVEFAEVAGGAFTAQLGTFDFDIPGLAVWASIDWGDGQTSAGTITKIAGDDYVIAGTHTYALKGTYRPQIIVSARAIPVPGEPTPLFVLLVGSFHSIINVKDPT